MAISEESHRPPDPDTFERHRDTPPISIAMLLRKYALFLAERSIHTSNLYRDASSEVLGSGGHWDIPEQSLCQALSPLSEEEEPPKKLTQSENHLNKLFFFSWVPASCHKETGRSSCEPSAGRVRPRQGTEICKFGAPSPFSFTFSSGSSFCSFSRFSVKCCNKSTQNVEKIARFPGGEKSVESCHVSGCRGFVRPDFDKVRLNEVFPWYSPYGKGYLPISEFSN